MLDGIFGYLNRHWVPRCRYERLAFRTLQLGMVLWRDTVLRGSDGIMVRLANAVATASPAAEASLCDNIADVLGTHGEFGESLGRVPGGSTVRESQGALDGLPVYYAGSRCPHWTRLVHRQCSRTVKDTALTLILVAHALLNGPNGPHSPQLPRMPVELFELIMSFAGRTLGRIVYTDRTRPRAPQLLRYEAEIQDATEQAVDRKFIISYRLSDDMVSIDMVSIDNNTPFYNRGKLFDGHRRGWQLLQRKGTDPDRPEYVKPSDFHVGATLELFGVNLVIYDADAAVMAFMEANPDQFTKEGMNAMRSHFGK